ncbi:hypothetical protein Scep_011448 [Stephania cephalantha]|uniref:Uncharacterized protein n=1 Tax=Stephania cephalantha TaxID=152367 RepID=A0AAP0P8B2_9MAGN
MRSPMIIRERSVARLSEYFFIVLRNSFMLSDPLRVVYNPVRDNRNLARLRVLQKVSMAFQVFADDSWPSTWLAIYDVKELRRSVMRI